MFNDKKLWIYAFCLWVICTLSFMAAMGISSALFLIATTWALRHDRNSWRLIMESSLAKISLIYFLISALSLFVAWISPPLGLPIDSFLGIKKFHFFLLPFLAALALVKTAGPNEDFEHHPMWRCFYWMTIFVSLIGIAQFWGAYLFPTSWLDNRFFRTMATGNATPVFHAQGLMYFHLSFASAIGFACSYAWGRVLWPLASDTKQIKFSWFFLLLLSTLVFFYTYSRISWIAIVAMIITLGFLKKPRWGIFAILTCSILATALWFGSESIRGRWRLGINPMVEREQVWAAALAMVRDRPILGVGFGLTGHYSEIYAEHVFGHKPLFSSHAHNNFLDVLAATGIFGLLAFSIWWIILWRYLWRAFRDSPADRKWLPASCLAAFIAFQVNGLTQVNFFDGKSEHSLMLWAGIALALEWRRTRRVSSLSEY